MDMQRFSTGKLFGLQATVLDWCISYLEYIYVCMYVYIYIYIYLYIYNQEVPIQVVFQDLGSHKVQFLVMHYSLQSGIKYHLYADDTQLYVSLDPGNKTEHYIAEIQLWMTSNLLKLNEDKI